MSIWKRNVEIGLGRHPIPNTLGEHIGLRVLEIGEDYIRGAMPVDSRTVQSYGRLHGGASCVMAEELGSMAAALAHGDPATAIVGLEINANHVRGVTSGEVIGTARPLHIGRATQIWEIRIEDEQGRLVCISRLTTATVPLAASGPRHTGG
jgi:1,4-dihydroxy-2-naphthoyl-CoA hydrolase